MDNIIFSCSVNTSDTEQQYKPLQISATLNGNTVWPTQDIRTPTKIAFNVPDEEDKEWTVAFHVSGKDAEHTQVDSEGNIVSDVSLTLSDFEFDDIDINSIVIRDSLPYTHDFNGTGETVTEKFYDVAGCNGTIEIKFTTPFYLWLLENM